MLNGGVQKAIKSLQRGTFSLAGGVTSGNQTVVSVDMSKSLLSLLGVSNSAGSNSDLAVVVSLTSSTNVQFNRATSASAVNVGWELVEYM
jgi:hypothetical protein